MALSFAPKYIQSTERQIMLIVRDSATVAEHRGRVISRHA